MIKELDEYLKDVKAAGLKGLEKIIKATVIDPSGKKQTQEIKIRENPAFASISRIAPERESNSMAF